MAQDSPQAQYSEQYILNQIYDTLLKAIGVFPVGYDGANGQKGLADSLALKVTTSGTSTYVGLAAPGSAQASPVWQAFLVDSSSGTVVKYADGDAEFNNVATDLTTLTYS